MARREFDRAGTELASLTRGRAGQSHDPGIERDLAGRKAGHLPARGVSIEHALQRDPGQLDALAGLTALDARSGAARVGAQAARDAARADTQKRPAAASGFPSGFAGAGFRQRQNNGSGRSSPSIRPTRWLTNCWRAPTFSRVAWMRRARSSSRLLDGRQGLSRRIRWSASFTTCRTIPRRRRRPTGVHWRVIPARRSPRTTSPTCMPSGTTTWKRLLPWPGGLLSG